MDSRLTSLRVSLPVLKENGVAAQAKLETPRIAVPRLEDIFANAERNRVAAQAKLEAPLKAVPRPESVSANVYGSGEAAPALSWAEGSSEGAGQYPGRCGRFLN